jgi:serine/threonine protein kinase
MHHDPLIGHTLGHVRIDRSIGRGGMGQVYAGHDLNLDRAVAVKVIDARHRSDAQYAQRFLREARAVASWRHEHIVTIYAADNQDGLAYFVMEYLSGADLGAILRRTVADGRLVPHAEVLRIGQAIASALDYAHARGMIHRDIKPANVMIADDGRVVLVDFGLALDVQAGSVGEVFGSAHYLAPEQARRSSDAVPQSDLYALGVILYELLTGSVPFDDPSATSVAVQHLTLPLPSPRARNPDLPPAVEAVLVRALSKTPAERYPTGAALMAALASALTATPAATPPLLHGHDLVGQTLGDYQLEAPLGQGGMAVIYRGRDVRLNRTVAIKVIDTPFQQDSVYTQRFEREAQAIGQLEHPAIVRLYQYGDANGLLYMAMEYIDGSTLAARIADHRAAGTHMDPATVIDLIRTICAALDYAHRHGVIHRDVKPANILLDRHGRAVLADFGLALMTEVGTRGEVFGTPHYIAPEQAISSSAVVPQSDLYAVGVILYELLVGQLPFDGPDSLAIAMQQMTEPPPPPRQIRPDLSPALEAVILRSLAKDPGDRYPSGAALVEAMVAAFQSTLPAGWGAPAPPVPSVAAVFPPPATTPLGNTSARHDLSRPAADPAIHQTPTTMRSVMPAAGASPPPIAVTGGTARRPWRPGTAQRVAGAVILLVIVGLLIQRTLGTRTPATATTIAAQQTAAASGAGTAAGDVPGAPSTTPTMPVPASTSSAPPELNGPVVVEDALTAATWYTQNDASGSMGYADGRYRLATAAGTNTFWSVAPGSLAVPADNVVLAVNIEPRAGSSGILFGFRSLSNHYRLVTQADGAFRLERRQGRTVEVLLSGTGAGSGRLALVLRGTTAQVYGGTTLLGETTVPETPVGGQVGLILVTPEAGEVVFDTLTIRTAP